MSRHNCPFLIFANLQMACDCLYCRANNPNTPAETLHQIALEHLPDPQAVTYMVRNPATKNETIKIIIQRSEYDFFDFMALTKHPNISEELAIFCRASILIGAKLRSS